MKKSMFLFLFVLTSIFPIWGSEGKNEGKSLYESKCGRCHDLYSPIILNAAEWELKVREMAPLSGLNGEDESKIVGYLKSSARQEKEDSGKSFIIGGYLYTEYFKFQDSTNTFDAHYLSITMSGKVHERVTFYAEFELEHGGGALNPPFVEEAYLDFWLNRNTGVKIGAILTPFNKFDYFHGPLQNRLISRPEMSREIGVSAWKDVGVNLHGNLIVTKNFYLNYDLYLINGLGSGSRFRKSRQYKDNNNLLSKGIRVSGIFSDRLEAGVSYYSGPWDDEGLLDLNMYGFHLLGKIGNLQFYGEYSKADSENTNVYPDSEAEGYFIQGSYLMNKYLRTTIRYGTLDYLDTAEDIGRSFTDIDKRVLALGLSLNLNSSVVFKIEYDFVMEGDRSAPKENNILAFQAAVSF